MKTKSSTSRRARKTRVHPDFPLGKHKARGYWIKKVRGKIHYFGRIADDPDGQAALEEWLRVKDDLLAGRKPREKRAEGLTVKQAGDWFCNSKRLANEAGEITKRTLNEYVATCQRLADELGGNRLVEDLDASDFQQLRASIAKHWGPYRLSSEIQRVRSVFKFLFEAGLIDRPMNFGPGFRKPSKRVMRVQRASKPLKLFSPAEIHKLLDDANPQMRAMILLGVNLGYGNHDCGGLPLGLAKEAIKTGKLDWPRPKTGVPRRGHLWPETREALRKAIACRPKPKTPEARGCCFVTPETGKPWTHGDATRNSVSSQFTKLQERVGIWVPGRSFYALRHTFETVSGECCDQVATDLVMGHLDPTMAAVYRERVDDGRVKRVCEHVHGWLFGEALEEEEPVVVKFPNAS